MALGTVRETMAVLRESREAIREGRVAVHEGRQELEARYNRRKRQVESVERAVQLLQTDGPDTDIRRLFATLSSGADAERLDEYGDKSQPRSRRRGPTRSGHRGRRR